MAVKDVPPPRTAACATRVARLVSRGAAHGGDVDAGGGCSDKDKEPPLVKRLPQAQRPAAGERLAASDT
eukprot:7381184-Prymnesium_polylepis.1